MSCPTRYAEVTDYDVLFCGSLDFTDNDAVNLITDLLNLAGGEISAAIASVGACECTFDGWVYFYLAKINASIVALDKRCPCTPQLSDNERIDLRTWVDAQLNGIRNGTIELCSGSTGANVLAFGWAENNATEWSARDIANNSRMRTP